MMLHLVLLHVSSANSERQSTWSLNYVIVIAWEGVLYAEYSARGRVERTISTR